MKYSINDEAYIMLYLCRYYTWCLFPDVEGAIAHPEHMKRDNVIHMSTSVGDSYYFQTTSQTEVDAWIKAIHSGKCVDVGTCS